MPATDNKGNDQALLRDAVLEAGKIARRFAAQGFEKWDKKKGDPVTEADLAIDRYLRDTLLAARPDYGWLSEESEDDPERLTKRRVWIVDPIDGTRAFVKGRPQFAICASLVEEGRPVCAAVYNPSTERLYEAERGKGAYLNGQPIAVHDRAQVEHCRMLGYAPFFHNEAWVQKWPDMEISTFNSVALRMVHVATGEWDACVSFTWKSDWDIAASDLIVSEAGGRITNHKGEAFFYNQASTRHRGLVVAGPRLHRRLIARLEEAVRRLEGA